MTKPVRTRFAPSPTGTLHVGGARTALFCWLYARHTGGEFVLRIEDTDRERSTEAAVQVILDAMQWLGLECDLGPYFQTERMALYGRYVEQLLGDGHAYHCYCSREELDAMREAQRTRGENPRYDGRCRARTNAVAGVNPVVRFKQPLEGETVVDDRILGTMRFPNSQLDDFIIARSDGTPTYNFTVAVDDHEMAITHVIRGNDHVNNTPKQLNVLKAMGVELPEYAHVPMIMGGDGRKLSKRHGAVSVMQFRDHGYLPQAMVNYLARLGWSHGDQEIFSQQELIALFDIDNVNKAPSVFDTQKLNWLNQHYIKHSSAQSLLPELTRQLHARCLDLSQGPDLMALLAVQRERAQTLQEMAEKSEFAFRAPSEYDPKSMAKHVKGDAANSLEALAKELELLGSWEPSAIETAVRDVAARLDLKLAALAQPLRVALTGSAASPAIQDTLFLIGRDEAVRRIRVACPVFASRS